MTKRYYTYTEKFIADMMTQAHVTERELQEKKEVATEFGEILSWEYLCYVRENPVDWKVPTEILYAGADNLTAYETIMAFAERTGAAVTVMENGEHWFHTSEQMKFLDAWLKRVV